MNEEWREVKIDGFTGYEVSNLGRIRRIAYKAFYLNDSGYPVIQVSRGPRGGVRKRELTIHRLVAKAFLDNPNNLPEVNHKDGNKMNFTAENLEWVTRNENAAHAVRMGLYRPRGEKRRGEKNPLHKLTDEKVRLIHELAGQMEHKEIAKIVGVTQAAIGYIIRGKTWKHIPWEENQARYLTQERGRFMRGEKNPATKLTEAQVREIRALGETFTYKEIAAQFGITVASVGHIIRRETWTHI